MSGTFFHPPRLMSAFFIVGFGFRLRQPIRYARVMTSSPTMMSTVLPSTSAETPSLPADSSWPHQNFPNLIVKGVMFRRQHVEVECKVGTTVNTKFGYLVLTPTFSFLFP